MILKIYNDYTNLIETVVQSNNLGEKKYSVSVDNNNTFIVFERYTFRNGNRMSLSIVLSNKDDHVDAHIIPSGGARGMILSFDWGAGNSYEESFVDILRQYDIKYEIYESKTD